eukprot:scaffold40516_cov93-Cyclotella_meneghiniana.AAC.1
MALFAMMPQNMPSLCQERQTHSSDYGVKIDHPTTYDDNPSFKGPLVLEQNMSMDHYRTRIRRYYLKDDRETMPDGNSAPTIQLSPSASTATILKAIIDHMARKDAPVDVKEIAESSEFYLRTGKRLLGAARRVMKNKKNNQLEDNIIQSNITILDLCCGHGLTGMLFVACNPPRGKSSEHIKAVLLDQSKPKSHDILRDVISEVCPWVTKDTVYFVSSSLEHYLTNDAITRGTGSIVISTHACGSLTDNVLSYAIDENASAVAVMPCCYTGTDAGTPYGLRRMLGVSLSADVRRSFYLQNQGYHVDFASIPKVITPMNRIIVAEQRK